MLHEVEVRHGETTALIFATHGLVPKDARKLALELKFNWPKRMIVIRDKETHKVLEVL